MGRVIPLHHRWLSIGAVLAVFFFVIHGSCKTVVRNYHPDNISYDLYAPPLQSGMEKKLFEFYLKEQRPRMMNQIIFNFHEIKNNSGFGQIPTAVVRLNLAPSAKATETSGILKNLKGEQFTYEFVKKSFSSFNQLCLEKIKSSEFHLAQLAHVENEMFADIFCDVSYENY